MRLPNLSAGAVRTQVVRSEETPGAGRGVEPSILCGRPCTSSGGCPPICPNCVEVNGQKVCK